MTNQFKNKVAIVVGGASGIGRALCCELCRHGAIVTVCDIDFESAQNVTQILRSSGGQAEALFMNVTQMDSVQEGVDKIVVKYGVLDYFFNSAGIAIVGEMFDMTSEHWQRLIDVNLWGVFMEQLPLIL